MGEAALDWARDGAAWPHRAHSRFVDAAGLRWHVQHWPAPAHSGAPCVVLLHGTGASSHSWRALAPRLANRAEVVALDLPGHGFSGAPAPERRAAVFTLPSMARGVAALLATLGQRPALIVGHSAGAALALQMVLDTSVRPRAVLALNAALLPMGGPLWPVMASSARWIAGREWITRGLARRAQQPALVRQLIDGTGSRLDDEGQALYARLVQSPAHVASTLAMMAHWELPPLLARLPALRTPLQLLVGEGDRTVPPWQSRHVWHRLPLGTRLPLIALPGLGHLAHEEDPDAVALAVDALLREPAREGSLRWPATGR
jgi:magnesium chelatase accessory protein